MAKSKELPVSFSKRFIEDHVGYLMESPYLSTIELVANAYDAGASELRITVPSEFGDPFDFTDNGVGMTAEQFEHRWTKLSYNRLEEQGDDVEFPLTAKAAQRKALGRSGKGRHGAFCFADEYVIETHREGSHLAAKVTLVRSDKAPFQTAELAIKKTRDHGTTIKGTAQRGLMVQAKLRELLATKFLVDPSFSIFLNNEKLDLFSMDVLTTEKLPLPQFGTTLIVHQINCNENDRDSNMRGVTWWVRRRMVGEPSWESLSGHAYLDARKAEAKRFSFIVEADDFKAQVKDDWRGFHAEPKTIAAAEAVDKYVQGKLHSLLSKERKKEKIEVIRSNARILGEITPLSRAAVGTFVDEVQQKCPTISERDLARTVEVYAKLEQSRSGYDLLAQLSECSPDDLDTWNTLMKQWSATNADIVLSELHKRLSLIAKLTALIARAGVDELHELHPMFDRGLWMFGAEYEAIDFRSNRGMREVISGMFAKKKVEVSKRRPDIVAIPSSSIQAYGAPSFDHRTNEADGYRAVLIVELKATGVPITLDEIDQARNYCHELYAKGAVAKSVPIQAYVLGTELEVADESTFGGARILPRTYNNILERAHVRTFNLHQRLEQDAPAKESQLFVDEVLAMPQPRT